MRNKKNIYVYEKNKEALEFLKDFFKGHGEYSASFFPDVKTLKKSLKKQCHAVIAGSPEGLERVKALGPGCPILAMISPDDATGGLSSVVKHNIESYMLPPYYKEDLEYKLRTVSTRKDLFESLYSEKNDLEAVAELTYMLSSTLDPKEVLYLVVKKLSDIIKVTRCSVLSIGLGEKRYASVVSTFESPVIKDIRLDLKKYPEIMKAFRTKNAVVIKDAMTDPLMRSVRKIIAPIGIRSIVVAPVIFRDEVIGTLFLRTSRAGHVFTDREVKLVNAIANASANALYNAFLFEKVASEKAALEKLAITDFLTGVYNIRYFYHRLDDEFARHQRYNTPLSCIMFDLDYFKKINDTFGHRVGDIVLREFAQLVRRHTRKNDVFARYGGEEFILLLPQTGLQGAVVEAGRLREIINAYRFKALKGSKAKLTASMGIAACPHKKIKTQDNLIAFADNALFEAKNMGRNRVVVFR
ncbi:MAG: sensor domain-containing diguanylate cyclase [Thermodesulfovibrionales bacterium]|nr:sensor domain-containing diguanylate cyclase [Thermodesulfovibrionales bacterium]